MAGREWLRKLANSFGNLFLPPSKGVPVWVWQSFASGWRKLAAPRDWCRHRMARALVLNCECRLQLREIAGETRSDGNEGSEGSNGSPELSTFTSVSISVIRKPPIAQPARLPRVTKQRSR